MSKPLHAFVPGKPRQRHGHLKPEDLARRPLHEPLDHSHHIGRFDKRHLNVELREFGLPIGPQILVAKALGHLHVAVKSGHHQQLLVELRRLRQGEERTVIEPAGHEVVAGALWRAAAEHRRFHIDELKVIKIIAHDLHNAVPQEEIFLHGRPAQIEPAIFQPHLFTRQVGGARLENRRLGLVEHLKVLAGNLDRPGGELGVGGAIRAGPHRAPHEDHPFRPDGLRQRQQISGVFRAHHHLRAAPAIAEIDEDHPLVVANPVNPAAERHMSAEIFRTQFTAGVTSKHATNLSRRQEFHDRDFKTTDHAT